MDAGARRPDIPLHGARPGQRGASRGGRRPRPLRHPGRPSVRALDYFITNPHKVMVEIDAAQQILSTISTECVMADVVHNTGTKIQNKVVVLHQNAQHTVSSARDKVERLCHFHGMRLHRRRRRRRQGGSNATSDPGDPGDPGDPRIVTQQCNLCLAGGHDEPCDVHQ